MTALDVCCWLQVGKCLVWNVQGSWISGASSYVSSCCASCDPSVSLCNQYRHTGAKRMIKTTSTPERTEIVFRAAWRGTANMSTPPLLSPLLATSDIFTWATHSHRTRCCSGQVSSRLAPEGKTLSCPLCLTNTWAAYCCGCVKSCKLYILLLFWHLQRKQTDATLLLPVWVLAAFACIQ